MPKASLADEVFRLLAGRPEIKRLERSRSPCGGAKKRIKITRAPPRLTLTITEPDYPSTSFEIESTDVVTTAAQVQKYAGRQGVAVFNK